MYALTNEEIITTSAIFLRNRIIHPTTFEYIRTLLRPYAEAIELAADIPSIEEWLIAAFSSNLAESISGMIYALTDADPETNLVTAKIIVIQQLIAAIMTRFIRDGDAHVFPWDIQSSIARDEELSNLFGVNPEINTLPVDVSVDGQQFEHMLSEEFVMGLLLLFTNVENRFLVTMFGVPFSSDIVSPVNVEGVTRYRRHPDANFAGTYTISIFERDYSFATPDFLHGFATGAEWLEIDHHRYWSNLTVNNDDGHMPLTF